MADKPYACGSTTASGKVLRRRCSSRSMQLKQDGREASTHGIPSQMSFTSWPQGAGVPRNGADITCSSAHNPSVPQEEVTYVVCRLTGSENL